MSQSRSWPLATLRRRPPPGSFVPGLSWRSPHYWADSRATGKTVDRFHMIQRHKKHWSFDIRSHRLARKVERGLCVKGPWDAPSLIIFYYIEILNASSYTLTESPRRLYFCLKIHLNLSENPSFFTSAAFFYNF